MTRSNLAHARVVQGVDPQPLRARLRGARRTMRPAAEIAVGLWPLWVIGVFALGLTWVFALAAAP